MERVGGENNMVERKVQKSALLWLTTGFLVHCACWTVRRQSFQSHLWSSSRSDRTRFDHWDPLPDVGPLVPSGSFRFFPRWTRHHCVGHPRRCHGILPSSGRLCGGRPYFWWASPSEWPLRYQAASRPCAGVDLLPSMVCRGPATLGMDGATATSPRVECLHTAVSCSCGRAHPLCSPVHGITRRRCVTAGDRLGWCGHRCDSLPGVRRRRHLLVDMVHMDYPAGRRRGGSSRRVPYPLGCRRLCAADQYVRDARGV